jgi:hypothetical protein
LLPFGNNNTVHLLSNAGRGEKLTERCGLSFQVFPLPPLYSIQRQWASLAGNAWLDSGPVLAPASTFDCMLSTYPPSALLRPYVQRYAYALGPITPKHILPKIGASLFFICNGAVQTTHGAFASGLNGLHTRAQAIAPAAQAGTGRLLVELTGYGLSRFVATPAAFTNQVVDLPRVWGAAGVDLARQAAEVPGPEALVAVVDRFLGAQFRPPQGPEPWIFALVDRLLRADSPSDQSELHPLVPLSWRQVERLFKQLVGTDLRTYGRICRFQQAQLLLAHTPPSPLTDIGYEVGYFDQAHFSNDFLRLAGVRPSRYAACLSPTASFRRENGA